MINASRVTVSNIFNLLTEHGYLLKMDGNFIVTNLDFMEQLAEGARELWIVTIVMSLERIYQSEGFNTFAFVVYYFNTQFTNPV